MMMQMQMQRREFLRFAMLYRFSFLTAVTVYKKNEALCAVRCWASRLEAHTHTHSLRADPRLMLSCRGRVGGRAEVVLRGLGSVYRYRVQIINSMHICPVS